MLTWRWSDARGRARWWLAALALAAIVAIGAACDDDDDEPTDPGITDDEIVLGAHAPLSGPAGVTAAVQQGIGAYFDYLNRTDGGIDDREVRYEVRDDQFQPPQARIAVQELIEQEQVFAFLGNTGTPGHLASIEVINEAAVPDLMVLSAFPGFGDPAANPNTFRAIAAGSGEGRAMAVYLNQELPDATAAVLVQNDDFGAPYRIGFTNAFAGEVVGDATYEASATDVSSQMALLLEDDPDAIVVACFPQICASAIRSAREAGSDAQFLISSPGGIDALFQLVGDPANLEGTLVPGFTKTIGQTDDPAVAEHIEIMESEGVTPSNFTIMGQLFAELFIDILERADRLSRAALLEAAEETRDFQPDLALTPITFSADDHVAWESLRFWRAENGQFRPFGEVIPAN